MNYYHPTGDGELNIDEFIYPSAEKENDGDEDSPKKTKKTKARAPKKAEGNDREGEKRRKMAQAGALKKLLEEARERKELARKHKVIKTRMKQESGPPRKPVLHAGAGMPITKPDCGSSLHLPGNFAQSLDLGYAGSRGFLDAEPTPLSSILTPRFSRSRKNYRRPTSVERLRAVC